MTDTSALVNEETGSSADPVGIPQQSVSDDGLQALLDEFDRANAQQPEPATTLPDGNSSPDQSADQALADLIGPDPRIGELQSQVDALQTQAHRQQELEAFKSFADDLQSQLPAFCPPDYAETKLRALAHDPEIALAFDLRNTDKAAAKVELQKVQWELMQNPEADPKRVQELQQYGYRLQVAVNSAAILRNARLDIINSAANFPKPIDEEVSGWRSEIAASMRGASMPIDFKEPAPAFGQMSDAEFRDYTKRNYGF